MNLIPILFLAGCMTYHPMHVAFTNIEINREKDSVTVSHKIVIEDFSLLFFHLFEKEIKPVNNTPFKPAELLMVENYLKERFILIADQDTIKLNYVSKDQDEEFLSLYFDAGLKPEIHKLEINDMLMLDINMDQTNLVIVSDPQGHEKGLTFNWDNRKSVISVDE